MMDVETYNPPLTVEQQHLAYLALGAIGRQCVGRPRKVYAPAMFPDGQGNRCPVYATRQGGRGYVRWPTVLDAADALGVHYHTVAAYLDHPTAKLRGLRLTRIAPPPTVAEIRAEQDRLAATRVSGCTIGPAVLAARAAVAARKDNP